MTLGMRINRGFTLIELMVSMTIGSLILLLAATVLGSSGEGYERIGGNVATEREARALFSQLTTDLATACFHKDTLFEKNTLSWSSDRLSVFSLQPSQAQTQAGRVGDLCTVNYFIKDLRIGGKVVRCLMRGFRESLVTFEGLRSRAVAPLFLEDSELDEPIVFGVVSFEVFPKTRNDFGGWIDWVRNDVKGPEVLDIKLILARRELSAQLKTSNDWDGQGPRASRLVGNPDLAERKKGLEIYRTQLQFGHYVP
jgi:prepilin-type N-terminal cleavage/methylation domain-containing protein